MNVSKVNSYLWCRSVRARIKVEIRSCLCLSVDVLSWCKVMFDESYLRVHKREFLLQVVFIRLVKLLSIICLVSILGVVEIYLNRVQPGICCVQEGSPSLNFLPRVGVSTAALN